MGLVDQALKYYKGKLVDVVCALKEEDFLQEVNGILLDADGDCLIIEENDGLPPILINSSYVVWIEEGTVDGEGNG
jgi:hypothetical protein